ncbi:MAG: 4-hydroxy-tetrahydrodipicolinate synthase [Candidatus Kapaibacteriota bacterium]|jgi:4-hydroxy-tetrahydrodipicolinate synthase
MYRPNFKGTITALVTPFKDDLSIDFEKLKKLIDFQINEGIDALVIAGTTGESATLSSKEKLALIIQAIEFADGKIPIIAGTGSNNTAETIDMTLLAKEHGADAVLLVAPYYNKPSQEGLYYHYKAIADAVDIPQIIYNVPSRSSVNISSEIQLKLAEDCPNIVATKEASGNLEQIMEIVRNAPDNFNVLSGDDATTLPVILMGGMGVISVISNYAPKMFSECVNAALNGNYDLALDMHYKLFDLMRLNFIEPNPVPAKTILSMMGYMEENFRLPLVPITVAGREKLAKAAKDLGLI